MNEFSEAAAATPLMKGNPCETTEGSSISSKSYVNVNSCMSPKKLSFE
ncbi:hypothetical protein MtrunA17_Chr2g0280371 [Medicago truncatula]|uniref:Uncharacterized protein n=1 Tax=Medicago truncatula TaxID=3880 RepID=A0A396J5H4_MEDTR|nr:hypothetical protein MtrunA17_Chr2g0280371 [Medicago truncatula]